MPAFSRFLRYFMAVGRLGSIRKAADDLNVSASAIDRQILNVEAEIGMPLFERLPTGLRLTAAGEILMAAGGRWQKNLAEVRAQIEDLRGLKRGHVEIAVIDALAKGVIPAAIQSLQTRYPGITMNLRVAPNDQVRRMIATGEVDFGIFFGPESYREITVRAFVDVHLGFITPAGHPFGTRSEARFSACIGSPVVVPSSPLAVHQQIAVLEGTARAVLDRKATSDNIQMITSLVLQGVGIGILTSLDVITEVRAGLLAFTRISDPVLRPMTLALCTAAARPPSYAADLVLGEIQSAFGELAWPAAPVAPVGAQFPVKTDPACNCGAPGESVTAPLCRPTNGPAMTETAAPVLNYIPYEDFLRSVRSLSRLLAADAWKPDFIIGIGRGGLVPAVYISHELQVPMLSIDHSSKVPGFADELLGKVADKSSTGTRLLFVDDINDSGGTIVYIRNLLAENGCNPDNLRFAVLKDNCRSKARVDYTAEVIDRAEDKRWFVFPWEAVMTAETLAEEAQAVPERLS